MSSAHSQLMGNPGVSSNIAYRSFQSGTTSRVPQQSLQVIENESAFRAYWQNSLGRDPRNAPTAGINWGREKLIAFHLGQRGTTGYSVFIENVKKGVDNIVRIKVVEQTPRPGQMVGQQITSPYTIIKIDRGTYSIAYDVSRQEAGSGFMGLTFNDQVPPGGTPLVQTNPLGGGTVPFKTIDTGIYSNVTQQSMLTFDTAADLQLYWQKTLGRDGRMAPTADVNWGTERILAIHIGTRKTGGFSVSVVGISRGNDGVARVAAYERGPMQGQWVSDGQTSPYVLIRVPKNSLKYVMDFQQRQ